MSNDPVKDFFSGLFGGKKKDEQDQQPNEQQTTNGNDAGSAASNDQPPVSSQAPFFIPEQPATQEARPPQDTAPEPAPQPFQEQTPVYQEPAYQAPSYQEPSYHEPAQSFQPNEQPFEQPAGDTRASEPPTAAAAPNPDVEFINGHAVGFAFLRYYREHPEIGQPVGDQQGDVGGYQMFENAILHWNGSQVEAEWRNGGQAQAQSRDNGSRSYTVQSGDSLWAIAQQFYGDGNQWQRIYEANRGQIANPDLIYPGQQLQIP